MPTVVLRRWFCDGCPAHAEVAGNYANPPPLKKTPPGWTVVGWGDDHACYCEDCRHHADNFFRATAAYRESKKDHASLVAELPPEERRAANDRWRKANALPVPFRMEE